MKPACRTVLVHGNPAAHMPSPHQPQERYPSLSLCMRVADNAFQANDILRMEQLLLNTLGFQLHIPSALVYMGILSSALELDADVTYRATFMAVCVSIGCGLVVGWVVVPERHHLIIINPITTPPSTPSGAVPVGCNV